MFELQGPRKKILLALAPRSKRQPLQWVFQSKLIGILCLFLLWGAIIESILHEMNIVYLLKLGVKAAYESGLTFLHGKNFSEMILIDLAENLRCSFILFFLPFLLIAFGFFSFVNWSWYLFICQLELIFTA